MVAKGPSEDVPDIYFPLAAIRKRYAIGEGLETKSLSPLRRTSKKVEAKRSQQAK